MILSSPESCLCAYRSGRAPRAVSARPPNMLTAKAAAVPLRSRASRVSAELARVSSSSTSATNCLLSGLDCLAERASCKALDEPVQKRVVQERQRDRRDQRRRHQRLPEEHVTSDQVVRNPCRHGPLLGARDERERVDELVHAKRE